MLLWTHSSKNFLVPFELFGPRNLVLRVATVVRVSDAIDRRNKLERQ